MVGTGSVPTAALPDRERRRRVLKGAAILSGVNDSAITCVIRNMHEHGAELHVHPESRIPADFLLYVPVDGVAYRSVVRWRKPGRCGVMFTGTEPKPRWYYG